MEKTKMSNHTFRKIMIPVTALIVVIGIALGIAASIAAPVLDHFLGTGEAITSGGSDLAGNYYNQKYGTAQEAKEAAYAVAEKVADEGIVLLKNNGVLPLQKGSEVTPYGYRYLSPTYGQMGSGSGKEVRNPGTPEAALKAYYTVNSAVADKMKSATVQETKEAPGTVSASQGGGLGGNSVLYEYAPSVYSGVGGVESTTAIVFIGREGHEDMDYKYDGYEDGTPHYLALSENEKEMISAAKASCKNVVIVVLSSATIELGPVMGGELEVDAIVWAGHLGERGMNSLGKILSGDVNPSGRTVDIFPADFTKDPSYQNFGEMYYDNAFLQNGSNRPFIEYEEGIYYGYRFYETAIVEDDAFVYGTLDGKGAIAETGAVLYPFGYGLSYTTFEKSIADHSENGGKINVTVTVRNTGEMDGKDVVELYLTAPYTDYDRANRVEKSEVSLIDFAKTKSLGAGESESIAFELDPEDFVSYDASHDNGDGTTGAYMLEAGEYVISLRANSHDVIDSFTYTVPETIYYTNANPRSAEKEMQAVLGENGIATDAPEKGSFIAASNLFSEMTEYMREEATVLTRGDWKNTFPTTPENRTKSVPDKYSSQFGREQFDYETDPELGNVPGSKVYSASAPVSGAENSLSLSMMRGKDFNDPAWDELLDEIDWTKKKQITDALFAANYNTGAIESIGLPATIHADGANGLKVETGLDSTATYGWAPLMASTWNVELLYEVGEAMGQEALANDIFGWYSPAFNLHRSPFCGRIFEYYSEDPVLSGKIATAAVSGAGDNGLQCYIKHFAMNDVETNRANYLHTWATEQTAREIYLKPFEMVIRNARMTVNYYNGNGEMASRVMRAANAMMVAQNCFGTNIAFGHYKLITGLVRNEWGFDGVITTDMYYSTGNNIQDLTLRAGCDTYLITMNSLGDRKSSTGLTLLRNAIHHLAYSAVNSNVMQGVAMGGSKTYGTSPWVYWLIILEAVLLALAAGGVVWMVLRQKDEKKNPEKYRK